MHRQLIQYKTNDPPGTVQYINPRYIVSARFKSGEHGEPPLLVMDVVADAEVGVTTITLEGDEALAAKEALDSLSIWEM